MFTKNNIFIISIFLALIIFQIAYYINSEQKYKNVYEEMLVNEAKIYFENIMLKKAQGLDITRTIENRPMEVHFELLTEDSKMIERVKKSVGKLYYDFDKDKEYFYYYELLNVQKTCIECHNKYQVGEVAGVVKVSINTTEYMKLYKDIHSSKYIYM